jgi:hypothetical protein
MRQVERREMFTPKSEYILEAAPSDSFSTLEIEQQTQGRYVGNKLDMPETIAVEQIALDLLSSFRDGFGFRNVEGKPGIWITESKNGIPTAAEIEAATRDQMLFADSVIEQATRFWRRKKYEDINEVHHMMAAWRGVEGLDWQEGTSLNQAMKCPFCKKAVPGGTIKCQYCTEIIDYEAYEAMRFKIGAPAKPEPEPEPEEVEVETEEEQTSGGRGRSKAA